MRTFRFAADYVFMAMGITGAIGAHAQDDYTNVMVGMIFAAVAWYDIRLTKLEEVQALKKDLEIQKK